MEQANDIEKYATKVNSQCVYVFLASLDSHLDGVYDHFLATIPLPSLQIAYAMVCAEVNCQNAMLGETSNEWVAMATRKSSSHSKKMISS